MLENQNGCSKSNCRSESFGMGGVGNGNMSSHGCEGVLENTLAPQERKK